MTEMVANARAIANAVEFRSSATPTPATEIRSTSGARCASTKTRAPPAMHIEDQVFPNDAASSAGKQVIPLEEMVPKVRAACDARRDPTW